MCTSSFSAKVLACNQIIAQKCLAFFACWYDMLVPWKGKVSLYTIICTVSNLSSVILVCLICSFILLLYFICYSIDYLPKASSLIWKKESIAMQNSSWCINSWVWFQWANFICPDMYANAGHKFFSNCFAKISLPRSCIYLFVPNAPFLYPLKASENHTVFWCFQGIEKGGIGNEWVNCQNSPKAFPLKSSREDKLHIEPRTVQIDVMMKYSINPKVSTS